MEAHSQINLDFCGTMIEYYLLAAYLNAISKECFINFCVKFDTHDTPKAYEMNWLLFNESVTYFYCLIRDPSKRSQMLSGIMSSPEMAFTYFAQS